MCFVWSQLKEYKESESSDSEDEDMETDTVAEGGDEGFVFGLFVHSRGFTRALTTLSL